MTVFSHASLVAHRVNGIERCRLRLRVSAKGQVRHQVRPRPGPSRSPIHTSPIPPKPTIQRLPETLGRYSLKKRRTLRAWRSRARWLHANHLQYSSVAQPISGHRYTSPYQSARVEAAGYWLKSSGRSSTATAVPLDVWGPGAAFPRNVTSAGKALPKRPQLTPPGESFRKEMNSTLAS